MDSMFAKTRAERSRPGFSVRARTPIIHALLLFPPLVQASLVTSTWQGGASGGWNDAANWSPSAAFPQNAPDGDTYSALISGANVSLTSDIELDALTLANSTLSGAHTLTVGFDDGVVFSGANHIAPLLRLRVGSFSFVDDSATLTNHGILGFDAAQNYSPSNATLTNAADGIIRNDTGGYLDIGTPDTSPFSLVNHGTLLSDNDSLGYTLYASVTQSASGRIRAMGTHSYSLSLGGGGMLAGTLQAASPNSFISLFGTDKTYVLDQIAILGSGEVAAHLTHLTGSIATGRLYIQQTTLTGSFVNHAPATVVWDGSRFAADDDSLVNHGTLIFEVSSGYSPSSATLTNASDGIIRTSLVYGGYSVDIGGSGTAPFLLVNHGILFADNGSGYTFYTPFTQSASGLINATNGYSFFILGSGATLAGTLQAESPDASITLRGTDKNYTFDQTSILGSGKVTAYETSISGTLASGRLHLHRAIIAGSFVNQSQATLVWDAGIRFADSASLTNHGTLHFAYADSEGHHASSATITNVPDGIIRSEPGTYAQVGTSLVSPFALVNHGTLLADDESEFLLHASVTNTGLVHLKSGSWLSLGRGLVQTSGEIRVEDDADLSIGPGQILDLRGGLLRADGYINALGGVFTLADTVLELGPAETAENLLVDGDLTVRSGSSARFDLTDLTPASGGDSLSVSGNISLHGELVLRLTPALAATLTPTDTMTLISATTVTGTFANVQTGQRLAVANGTGSFVVTITGTQVRVGGFAPSAFLAFLLDADVAPSDRAPDADPDGDGLSNLLEYALGGDPAHPDATLLPVARSIGGVLTLAYRRVRTDVTYVAQTATDLEPTHWTATGVDQGTPDENGAITATVPMNGPRRFLRLHVTLNP